MRVIVATGNPGKVLEFERIFAPFGIEPVAQGTLYPDLKVAETGTTFAENAFLKADAIHRLTGEAAVADDSGLCVDALGGAPGVYSARYAGEDTPYPEKLARLLGELADVPAEQRTAHFAAHICFIGADGARVDAEGFCEGKIGYAPRGENGFGFDPIFMVGEKSFSELDGAEKDAISHRGRALRELVRLLGETEKHKTTRREDMLTSKQRAKLRGLANTMETILQVGKGGVADMLIQQVDEALTARELIKMRALETTPEPAGEIARRLADATRSEVVQVIGTKFVLYRRNNKKPVIELD